MLNSQYSKTLLAGLMLGLTLVGCKKSDSGESAITANTYPAPAISFYSNDPYQGISYDDSMYLGGRDASMFYMEGRNLSSMDPNSMCRDLAMNGDINYMYAVTSKLGGYKNFYQVAGTQRYGSFSAGQGDRIARTRSWYDNQGTAVTMIRGGNYLVCLVSPTDYVVPSGMFMRVDDQLNGFVNFNLQYSSNMQLRFSQPYFGRQFRVARQFNNYTSRDSDFKPRRDNNNHRTEQRSFNERRQTRQSSRDENRATTPRNNQRNSEMRFESRSDRRDTRNSELRDSNGRNEGVIR